MHIPRLYVLAPALLQERRRNSLSSGMLVEGCGSFLFCRTQFRGLSPSDDFRRMVALDYVVIQHIRPPSFQDVSEQVSFP